jgi:hypothetical protein
VPKNKRSNLEQRLFEQLVEAGLTDGMVEEHVFHPTRRWRFDFAWPDLLIYCEVQGGIDMRGKHARAAGIRNDQEKAREASILGWHGLPVCNRAITSGAALDAIKRLMEAKDG